jgi:hypothetical protein
MFVCPAIDRIEENGSPAGCPARLCECSRRHPVAETAFVNHLAIKKLVFSSSGRGLHDA